jgi:hypothetical protein
VSATTNSTTTVTDEREPVKLERTNTLECSVGKTNLAITVQADRFTREQLESVIDRAHTLGITLTTEAVHSLVGELCGDSVEGASDSIEPCLGKYTDTNGEITVVVDHEFTHEVNDPAQLYTITDHLVATIVGEVSMELVQLRVEEIRRNNPSPAYYYESLLSNGETSVADLVPPNLEPEHWREFVNCFAGMCFCGQPTCTVGILLGLTCDYDGLIACGLSEEAAKAVLDNAALKYAKDAKERAVSQNGMVSISAIPLEVIGTLRDLFSSDGRGPSWML